MPNNLSVYFLFGSVLPIKIIKLFFKKLNRNRFQPTSFGLVWFFNVKNRKTIPDFHMHLELFMTKSRNR